MSLSTSVHDVRTLIQSFHPVLTIETPEEERVGALLATVAAEAGLALFEWSVTTGLRQVPGGHAMANTTDPLYMLRHMEGLTIESIFHLKDFSTYFAQPAIARKFREVAQRFSHTPSCLVLSGPRIGLPPEIEGSIVRYELRLPSAEELRDVLRTVLGSLRNTTRIAVTLEPDDLERLIQALSGMTLNQARQAIAYAALQHNRLGPEEIPAIVERKLATLRDNGPLEYFPVEDNRFALAGFANLKRWLERAQLGFSAEARELNLAPPRGILLVGVQGCGKSLAAKVVAREWKLPLLKLDMGRLYDKYIGETDKNFRKAISLAESIAPAVLWLDEIEKGLGSMGGSEGDGGVSRRIFASFLTWLQEKEQAVFTVATANNLSSLPPELLRKGRFDKIFFVDLPNEEERQAILTIHLELRKQDPAAFRLEPILAACEGFSGAEIEQAVVASLYRALHQARPLDTELLLEEMTQTVPLSVSRREDVEALRQTGRERFVSLR